MEVLCQFPLDTTRMLSYCVILNFGETQRSHVTATTPPHHSENSQRHDGFVVIATMWLILYEAEGIPSGLVTVREPA